MVFTGEVHRLLAPPVPVHKLACEAPGYYGGIVSSTMPDQMKRGSEVQQMIVPLSDNSSGSFRNHSENVSMAV